MEIINVFGKAASGVYYAATHLPGMMYQTFQKTAQGCFEHPKAIPVLATSILLANAGAVMAYKGTKSAVGAFRDGEKLQGARDAGIAVAGASASIIGGASTIWIVCTPLKEWANHDFSVIKETASGYYTFVSFIAERATYVPEGLFRLARFLITDAIQHPFPAFASAATLGLVGVEVTVGYRLSKSALQAFREGDYNKVATRLALVGVVGVATAVTSFASVVFYLKR